VSVHSSRRRFLQAGLALPAAGLVASSPAAAAAIPYRTLGKTRLKVAPVGFGVGFTPDPSVIARSLDMGVNYFDTARDYAQGNSERLLGMALKGRRDNVVLVSKSMARSGAEVLSHIDVSLKTLGTDHVDAYLMHAKDTPESIPAEVVDTLDSIKKQGKTRFIGVSTHDPNAVVDHILKLGKIDIVLITYSFAMGSTRDEAIEKLHDAGIGVAAMKVMGATSSQGRGGRGIPTVKPMPTKEGSLAALKWALRNPGIAVAIPFMRDEEQLAMNVRAMTESLTPEEEKLLVARSEEIRALYCRMCYQCKGQCPQGLPVTDMLRFLAYNDFYGDFHQARENFMRLPREVRNVSCQDCSSCAIDCPNGVQVRDRLIRAQQLLA
jgi:predicted aldo/keto reductase-like oxidoreductase